MELKFKILNIFLILAILCSISSVVAMEDCDIMSDDIAQSEESLKEEIQVEEDTLKDSSQYTFSDLANQINAAEGNETTIKGTYVYDDEKDVDYKDGLVVNKNLKVTGNNLTIDGKNKAILNFIGSNSFELKDVKIINCIINNENNGLLTITSNNITNSRINNYENMALTASMYNSNISNYNGNLNVTGYAESSNLENNNGLFFCTEHNTYINSNITINDGSFVTDSGSITYCNLAVNGGTFESFAFYQYLNITNNGKMNFSTSYVGTSNVVNNGEILIQNYFGESNLTNYGTFYAHGTYTTKNAFKNYGIVSVAPRDNSNYFDKNNIENHGVFEVVDNCNGNFDTNITNYGNFTFNGLKTKVPANYFNIVNKGNLTINNTEMQKSTIESNGFLNMTGANLKNVSITNDGTFSTNSMFNNCNITNNNLFVSDRSPYFVYGNILNNGDIIFQHFYFTDSNLTNNGNIVTDIYSRNINLINRGNIDFNPDKYSSPYMDYSNITNSGNFEIGNYLANNNIVNTGNFISNGSYCGDNKINNKAYFAVTADNRYGRVWFFGYDIENYGTFNVTYYCYGTSDKGFNITNYGDFIYDSKDESKLIPLYNGDIKNYGNLDLIGCELTGANITNKGTLSVDGGSLKNINLTNSGDVKISDRTNSSGIVIEKLDAKVTASKVSMYYGATKYITIKVVDSQGNPIKNTKFTVTINKKNYQATSNANGVATLKVPILNVGSYSVSIKGENPYCNSIATIKITVMVSKAKTSVKAPKKTFKYKKSKKFTITVKSKVTKKAVSKVKIKVKVYTGKKYKVYKLKTNKKGVAKLNTKKLKKGKHKVVISSLNKNYKISKKSLIRIK